MKGKVESTLVSFLRPQTQKQRHQQFSKKKEMYLTDKTRTIHGFYLPQASNCPSKSHDGESQRPLGCLTFQSYFGSFIGSYEKEQEESAVPEAS